MKAYFNGTKKNRAPRHYDDDAVITEIRKINERLVQIEKNQLIAKVALGVISSVAVVIAYFIDHWNLFTELVKNGLSDQNK